MQTATEISGLQAALSQANQILILTRENPSGDSLGASLALYLVLQAAGKKAAIACSTPATVEFNKLTGLDKISQELPSKNFVVSLDYVEGSIEKVSYNINGDKFNLVIEPKPGAPVFSSEKVHFSSTAASPDLIFLIDCANLEELGKFYQERKDLFSSVPLVNIDRHANNSQFGKINLVDPGASCVSEMVALLLRSLGVTLTEDVAGNLLSGLVLATNNFSLETAGAGAFEAAAICFKAGGKRMTEALTAQEKNLEAVQAPADWLQPKIFKSKSTPALASSGESTTL